MIWYVFWAVYPWFRRAGYTRACRVGDGTEDTTLRRLTEQTGRKRQGQDSEQYKTADVW